MRGAAIALAHVALAASLAWGVAGAADGKLSDPTRPPNAALAAEVTDGGVSSARLQSVLISPGRMLAVINGETVRLGGRYGEARLIRITESAVILRHADRDETLNLLPGVEKQSRSKAAAARPAGGKK